MAARHPRRYACIPCNRVFGQQFALGDHYRGSFHHPNCVKCGLGFEGESALAEHKKGGCEVIAKCRPCGAKFAVNDFDKHRCGSSNQHDSVEDPGLRFNRSFEGFVTETLLKDDEFDHPESQVVKKPSSEESEDFWFERTPLSSRPSPVPLGVSIFGALTLRGPTTPIRHSAGGSTFSFLPDGSVAPNVPFTLTHATKLPPPSSEILKAWGKINNEIVANSLAPPGRSSHDADDYTRSRGWSAMLGPMVQ